MKDFDPEIKVEARQFVSTESGTPFRREVSIILDWDELLCFGELLDRIEELDGSLPFQESLPVWSIKITEI